MGILSFLHGLTEAFSSNSVCSYYLDLFYLKRFFLLIFFAEQGEMNIPFRM